MGGVVLREEGGANLGPVGGEVLEGLDSLLASPSIFLCLLNIGLWCTSGSSSLTSTIPGRGVAGTVGGGKSGRLDIDSAELFGGEVLGGFDSFLTSPSTFLCLLNFGLWCTSGSSSLTGGGVSGTVGGGKSGRLDIDSAELLRSPFC